MYIRSTNLYGFEIFFQQHLQLRNRYREARRLDFFPRVGVLPGRCDRRITAQWSILGRR